MASKGRKQTWHVLLSALAGALGGFSQSYSRTKEKQADRDTEEAKLSRQLDMDMKKLDEQQRHNKAMEKIGQTRADSLAEQGLSEEEAFVMDAITGLKSKGKLPAGMQGQQPQQPQAPQGPPAKPGIPSIFEGGIQKAMQGAQQPQRTGMPQPQQPPAPQQQPQPQQGRTMGEAAQRRTGMAPPQQPQLGRMAQVTPQDEEFARMPGMASTDQDRMQAMNLSRAYEVAMNDSYPMEERAMAWVALNQIMGIPVPEPLLAYLRTGITPSQNQTPQQARTMGVA